MFCQIGTDVRERRLGRLDEAAMAATTETNVSAKVRTNIKVTEAADALDAAKRERSPLQLLSDDGTSLRNPWWVPPKSGSLTIL